MVKDRKIKSFPKKYDFNFYILRIHYKNILLNNSYTNFTLASKIYSND